MQQRNRCVSTKNRRVRPEHVQISLFQAPNLINCLQLKTIKQHSIHVVLHWHMLCDVGICVTVHRLYSIYDVYR